MKQHLESKGFQVDVETSVTNFFTLLCDKQPGFVLISRNLEGSMAKQLPDFLQKRFKIPVMLFQEMDSQFIHGKVPSEPDTIKRTSANCGAEIVNLQSDDIEKLESHISNFEHTYLTNSQKPSLSRAVTPNAKVNDLAVPAAWSRLRDLIDQNDAGTSLEKVDLYNVRVKDSSSENLILIGLASGCDVENLETLQKIEFELKRDSVAVGEIQAIPSDLAKSLYSQLYKKANMSISGTLFDKQIQISLFHEASEPDETKVSIIGSHFSVPIEEWWVEHRVSFHAYLWFELNRKKILYVKKGRRLSKRAFEKFKHLNYTSMLINADDMPKYRTTRQLLSLAA